MFKPVIGIYLDKDTLHYVCVRRSLVGWKPVRLTSSFGSNGVIYGQGNALLKDFLRQLLPGTHDHIFLTLPRSLFFIRDIRLPAMPMEDALLSVQNSLSIVCHLPLEEIHHDILLTSGSDGQINALIVYAHKKDMGMMTDIFKEAGFEKALKGLFPFCVGFGAGLSYPQKSEPLGLVIRNGDQHELAVYHNKGCLASVLISESKESDGHHAQIGLIQQKYNIPSDRLFGFQEPYNGAVFSEPVDRKLKNLPDVSQNRAMASLMPVIANRQNISVDAGPTRLKMFAWSKIVIPAVIAIAIGMSLLTHNISRTVTAHDQSAVRLKEEVKQLRQKIRPLEQDWEKLKKTKDFYKSMDEFLKTRPQMYSQINEIARLSPEGTWFSRFTFQGDEMTLQGQGPDGLKVIESIRTSTLFEQVKLIGSVSRSPSGVEQFSISVKLKKEEPAHP